MPHLNFQTYKKVNGGLMDSLALRLIQPRGTISEVELDPELNIARSSISIQATEI